TTLYPKESGLTVSFLIQRKPSSAMAGVFASYGRLKHRTDEWLSTTLYPKESGLTVSFLIQRKPSSAMAGVFASYGRLKHRTDECLSTTLAGIGRGCSRSVKASATTWQ
ncbi:hypothetical protein, partial [Klebsiella grimontii]